MKEGSTESPNLLLRTLRGGRSWVCCAHANRIAEVELRLITSLRRKAHFQFPVPKCSVPSVLLKPRLTCA